eukprot:jgi/Mesvir1/3275/Mv16407-RA.1
MKPVSRSACEPRRINARIGTPNLSIAVLTCSEVVGYAATPRSSFRHPCCISSTAAMDYFPANAGRNHLFVPGPTNIPEEITRAMMRNNEDHRSPAFPSLSREVIEDTKKLFKTTKGTTFVFPSTGTGGWESCLTNTLNPGDKVISFRIGQFSLLWCDMMQRLNFDVDIVDSEWGAGADLDALRAKIAADKGQTIRAVCIVHNETATGVTNNIPAVRQILDAYRHPAFLFVDGVSSIGALDFRFDEWGVDCALTGSQKALGMPTGIALVCAGPRALEAAKTCKSTRVFFDWADYLKFYKMGTYWPYTPSIQMLYGLKAAYQLLFAEGLENVFARHTRLATATRAAVAAWGKCVPGIKLCTQKPEWHSDTVTTIMVPPSVDSNKIIRIAWKKYNLSLGMGLNKIMGKAFRIGHLGNLNELQILAAISGAEMAMLEAGLNITLGSGVAAAQQVFMASTPWIPSRTNF